MNGFTRADMKITTARGAALAALTFALVLPPGPAAAAPQLIHYQGRLLSGTNLVNGPVALALGLYTNAIGGAAAYIDSNPAVTVVDGLYATDIGDDTVAGDLATALTFPALWLDVQVNGVPLTPREPLASVAYALSTGPRGLQNVESGSSPVVGGGLANDATANFATSAGGLSNLVSGYAAAIGGGQENAATNTLATIGGGLSNLVTGAYGTIGGGRENGALGDSSSVGGGYFNGAYGFGSTVPGGVGNGAMGDYSFAAGRGAVATNAGAFVWGDNQAAYVFSSAPNQVTFRCAAGVRFTSGTNAVNQMVSWAPGQASWSFSSDRNLKENLQPLDVQDVLRRVCRVPLTEWNYIGYDIRHIGPMAQDFHAAFNLGGSDTMISEADAIGVALASIQGLQQQVAEKAEENRGLQRRLEALERRLQELEARRN